MMIRLDGGDAGFHAEGGILRAHSVGAVLDAAALVHYARQQADELLAGAADEAQAQLDIGRRQVEEMLAQAREKTARLLEEARLEMQGAEQRGFAQGEQQAALQWHERHAQLASEKVEGAMSLERDLAGVVMQAVRRIVDAEPREALFARALQTVQSQMRASGGATLRVSPDDTDAARAALAALAGGATHEWAMEVQPDATLPPGSSVFSSELGTLDASLEAQLAALRFAMDRAVKKALAEPGEPAERPSEQEGGDDE